MHTCSEGTSPQLLEVNCTALDSLVLEYLASAELIEDSTSQDNDCQLTSRLAAFAAYEQLHQGNVCNAMVIVSKFCPEVLQDQRLAFKLKRQQFIELLRQSTTAGDEAALACARDELAPMALDAYPEAYLDFKRVLLMLVQPQQQQQQHPVQQQHSQQQQQDGSLAARHQLAEVLHHTMLQQMGCSSPQLAQLLAYLAHIFSLYTSGSHGSSRSSGSHTQLQQQLLATGSELAAGLLLEGRDEGPQAPDTSGMPATERDVQALMAAVSIPRLAALNALKAAGGDAAAALAGQLMRFRLNSKKVDALAWEYAAARGLLEPEDGLTTAAAAAAAATAAVTDGPAAAPSDMDVDQAPLAATPPAAIGGPTAAAEAAEGPSMARTSSGGSSKAQKRSNGGSDSSAAASEAGPDSPFTAARPCPAAAAGGPVAAAMLRSASQSPPYKVPRWRCKQTPSRFLGQLPGHAAAAAASPGTATADSELRQETRLLQVIVDSPGAEAPAGGSSSGQKKQAAQQHQHQQELGQPGSSSTASDALAEQLLEATRVAHQQQRWQQLQCSFKSKSLAASGSSRSSGGAARQQEVQASLAQLQGLAKQGSWVEVEALVEELQPGLLKDSPGLRFELKRCQFVQLVQSNELPAALQLVRSQLTPLADAHPELLPCLKASMALLLPGPAFGATTGAAGGGSSSSAEEAGSKLLSQLLPLLQSRLGVEPPALVKLFRVLLTGHKGWFRVQRCQDPFTSALGLDKLLQAEPAAGPGGAAAGATANPDAGSGTGAGTTGAAAGTGAGPAAGAAAAAGGIGAGAGAGMQGALGFVDADMVGSEDAEQLEFDEAEVLQVMEVLELPRATALELLAEQGGDAQAVIMQAFGG